MPRYPLDIVDEMYSLGVEMRRQRARRENTSLDEAGIAAIVRAWLVDRPEDLSDPALGRGVWPRR